MNSTHFVLCESPLAFINRAREQFPKVTSDICDISGMKGLDIRSVLTKKANGLIGTTRILYVCGLETVAEEDLDGGLLYFLESLKPECSSTCEVKNPKGLTIVLAINKSLIGYANSTEYLCVPETKFHKLIPEFCISAIKDNC